jgi:hypothetical protein
LRFWHWWLGYSIGSISVFKVTIEIKDDKRVDRVCSALSKSDRSYRFSQTLKGYEMVLLLEFEKEI